jgi:putative component of membrane protein insertase Oxa1/YidC/SpoIIIJ protein YidD
MAKRPVAGDADSEFAGICIVTGRDSQACAQAIDGAAQSPVTAIASVLRVMRIFMCPPMRSGGFELLGRRELKHLTEWNDGQPGTELNFKFYRQATDTIVGISDEAAAFLSDFF